MSNAIEVENLSKRYRLGNIGYASLRDDLASWYNHLRGKDAFLQKKIATNDRTEFADSNFVWSLQDINFTVERGEVLGIIGKNGAGKSTLLKILSRVTSPTKGEVRINGRIASLLEVGTGFHPELTGRENIFLNGAILGMRKQEIKAKFDEIVAFAGIEKYIDTPVKRYSSGMYVRLAFAVAAHLEPEILIVDEVLAVGDAEFQKKCLGKMKDVSSEGRTILFVSHNLAAVKTLCNKGLFLEHGSFKRYGNITDVITHYNGNEGTYKLSRKWDSNEGNIAQGISLIESKLVNSNHSDLIHLEMEDAIELETSIELNNISDRIDVTYHLKSYTGEKLFSFSSSCLGEQNLENGLQLYRCHIPPNFFNEGSFYVDIYIVKNKRESIYIEHDILSFNIHPKRTQLGEYMGTEPGFIHPRFNWQIV